MQSESGMFESADNKVFIGTTEGFLIYDKQKDKKSVTAPFNNINSIEINDVPYPYQSSFVLPYKKYKVKIYIQGLISVHPIKSITAPFSKTLISTGAR
jgi:hypothetical protein